MAPDVLRHHDGGVHHHAHREGQAAQAHQVGAEANLPHHDEADQVGERQREHDDEGGAQFGEEEEQHQDDEQAALPERVHHRLDAGLDERGAVVEDVQLHPRRKRVLHLRNRGLDAAHDVLRVRALEHDDHARHGFALAVARDGALAGLGPDDDVGNIPHVDGGAVDGLILDSPASSFEDFVPRQNFDVWLLVGVLLVGFAIMDGHDMGVGTLLPFVGKNDVERRVVINTVGPHWDGNQVWFITGGGAIFAAWPLVYATAFSGFYWAMLAVLWALFFRPVGFDYRSKVHDPRWRTAWDWGLFVGSAVPSLLFGVAMGNVLQGVPFHYDDSMRSIYTGSFWALLNPFALLAGVVSLAMIIFHGANYLIVRTEGDVQRRAARASLIFGVLMMAGFAVCGLMLAGMQGYVQISGPEAGAVQSPVGKVVAMQAGAWLGNFAKMPLLWAFPALGFLGGLLGVLFAARMKGMQAFVASSVAMLGIIFTVGVAMFPFVLPSSAEPGHSLTAWDCVSSEMTLDIMFWVALIMTPIVFSYTAWAYRVMRGKITIAHIEANDHSVY